MAGEKNHLGGSGMATSKPGSRLCIKKPFKLHTTKKFWGEKSPPSQCQKLVDSYRKYLFEVTSAKEAISGIKAKGVLTFSTEENV